MNRRTFLAGGLAALATAGNSSAQTDYNEMERLALEFPAEVGYALLNGFEAHNGGAVGQLRAVPANEFRKVDGKVSSQVHIGATSPRLRELPDENYQELKVHALTEWGSTAPVHLGGNFRMYVANAAGQNNMAFSPVHFVRDNAREVSPDSQDKLGFHWNKRIENREPSRNLFVSNALLTYMFGQRTEDAPSLNNQQAAHMGVPNPEAVTEEFLRYGFQAGIGNLIEPANPQDYNAGFASNVRQASNWFNQVVAPHLWGQGGDSQYLVSRLVDPVNQVFEIQGGQVHLEPNNPEDHFEGLNPTGGIQHGYTALLWRFGDRHPTAGRNQEDMVLELVDNPLEYTGLTIIGKNEQDGPNHAYEMKVGAFNPDPISVRSRQEFERSAQRHPQREFDPIYQR